MTEFRQVIPRLPSRDLPRTIAFYTERLGFEVDVAWPEDSPSFVILRRDATSIGFFEPSEHQPGTTGYVELYIKVDDALELHSAIAPHMAIEWGPEIYSYDRREFAVRDPDGYLVIFTEPTDEPPTTPEPL
jgi:catechol 2,3-dioxygenase-like lactoylglutathione lyase family enzyme